MADDIMARFGFGVAEPDAEERMRGIAKQLRGDRGLGQLFQYSGNKDVRSAGEGLVRGAEATIGDIGKRRQQGLTRAAQAARDARSAEEFDMRYEQTEAANEYSQGRDVKQDAIAALAVEYKKAQDEVSQANSVVDQKLAQAKRDRLERELQQQTLDTIRETELAATTRREDREQKLIDDAKAHERAVELQGMKNTLAQQKADAITAAKKEAKSTLTEAQKQTGLKTLNTEMKPLLNLMGKVDAMDKALAPYAKGGAAENENIPGVGFIEGSPSMLGGAVRMAKGQEAQDVFRASRGILISLIKESAGMAQTVSEVQNVLTSLGGEELNTEESLLKAITQLKEAIGESKQRLYGATSPQVRDQFGLAYQDTTRTNPFERKFQDLDFSNRYIERPGAIEEDADAGGMTRREKLEARIAELKGKQ